MPKGLNERRASRIRAGRLTNLTHLDLGNNQISTIPTEVGNLTTLTSLDLGTNRITIIPTQIGNLTNLEYLSLWGNQIRGDISAAFAPLVSTDMTVLLGLNNCPTAPDPTVAGWLDVVATGWRC